MNDAYDKIGELTKRKINIILKGSYIKIKDLCIETDCYIEDYILITTDSYEVNHNFFNKEPNKEKREDYVKKVVSENKLFLKDFKKLESLQSNL